MSVRLRVGLLTAAAVALVEIAIVASIYGYVSYRLYAQIEQDLRNTAGVILPVVTSTGDLPLRAVQDVERPPFLPRILGPDGRVISARSPLDLPVSAAARAVAAQGSPAVLETLRAGADEFYVLTVPVEGGRALQVARSLSSVRDVLGQLLTAAIVFAVAGVVAAPLAGALVARGSRLERLVDELERARAAQRQLVADASHELRAPLASLRANVELLSLDAAAPLGDRAALAADTLAGIEDLTLIVSQLIDLAREDQRVHQRAPVRLDDLVREEIERMRRRHPAVEVSAQLERTDISGDAEALSRAVANLLDNGAKWTPAGGTVHVRLGGGELEVRDEGPGIDPADLPHVFERFFRGARSAGVPGSGLGLAIVAQVLASHGGSVSARSSPEGGAVFTARFAPAPS